MFLAVRISFWVAREEIISRLDMALEGNFFSTIKVLIVLLVCCFKMVSFRGE